MAQRTLSMRLPEELRSRLEALTSAYAARRGLQVGITGVLKLAAERGLPELERELSRPEGKP